MPTNIVIPTDAFQESFYRDFKESPHHDRDVETGISFQCTLTLKRSLTVGLTRNGYDATSASFTLAARTALSATFMRYSIVQVNISDSATRTIVNQLYKTGATETQTDSGIITLDPGATHSHGVLLSDTDTKVEYRFDYVDDAEVLYQTITHTFDDPWTHAQFVAECKTIWDSKVGAWEISTSRTSEYWEYDTGTLVSGYSPLAGAAIIATALGGVGYYKDVLWNLEMTGGQYYFYMPTLVTGLLCKNRLTLLDYGSECTFIGVGGAGNSFINAVNLGDDDGFSDSIAGTDGVTIATQLPAFDLYPYSFAAHEYHQRAYKGNPITS